MSQELFQQMGENLRRIDTEIKEVQDMIAFLQDAGESVAEQKNKLSLLLTRRNNYASALRKRGVDINV